jgi:LAGLIDADG endonuclease
MQGIAGNTEGKIDSRKRFDPRNDSGDEIPGWGVSLITRRPWPLSMDVTSYISGFIDGEGCFCVSFQPSTRHRFGWEIRPSFSISQNADRAQLLYRIQELWKCGFIRPDRSDKTLKYEVRTVRDLADKVLPHFETCPLLSSKMNDVRLLSGVCNLIVSKRHLNTDGFVEIVRLAMQMNPSGKRKYTGDEILISLRSGERIVCATGNGGES